MAGPLRIGAEIEGEDAALAVAAALDELAGAVSAFETREAASGERGAVAGRGLSGRAGARTGSKSGWRCSPPGPAGGSSYPRRTARRARLAGGEPPRLSAAAHRTVFRAWLALDRGARAPPGSIPLEIDAATAFGTGEHPSTRGVLLALDGLARRRRFRRPLDIGTGTGVLAIAAAKRLHRAVLASDIDCAAARVAAHHVGRNGLRGQVRVICAPGYRARAVRRSRYDLILSNILARPLSLMARDLAHALAPGGVAVLSGLLRRQERMVLAAHRMQGLALARRIAIEGWSTLILRSGGKWR